MYASPQRSNFDGVFQPAPKRIHSLMDICEILARKKPKSDDSLELTEWHQSRLAQSRPPAPRAPVTVPRLQAPALVNSVLGAVQAAKSGKAKVHAEVDPDSKAGFTCPVPGCDKKYGRRFRVVEHILLRHETEGRPMFRCGEVTCLKTYDKIELLKAHQKSIGHRGSEIAFEAMEFRAPSESTALEVKLVEADNGLRYKCSSPGCDKSYSTRYRCTVHLTTCHGENNTDKPFTCPAPGCPKAYATKDSLNRHKRVCSVLAEATQEKREIVLKPTDDIVILEKEEVKEERKQPVRKKREEKKKEDKKEKKTERKSEKKDEDCQYKVTTQFKDRVQELVEMLDES